jgi:hypothetical protein
VRSVQGLKTNLFNYTLLLFLLLCTYASFASAVKVPYEILGREVITASEGLRVITQVRVIGDTIPSEIELKKIGASIWETKNQMWSEFTIFYFLESMNVDASAYAIAQYSPAGLKKITLQAFSLNGTRYVEQKAVALLQTRHDTVQAVTIPSYDITLQAKKPSPHRILVTATTNLPDNTLVSVVVSRPYLKQGSESEQLGEIFKKVVPVKNGTIELNDTVVDYKWYTALLETRKSASSPSDAFTGFKSISPRVKVDVSFSTADQTVSAVVAKLGQKGEKMNGPFVVKNPTSVTILRSAVTEIEFQK